MTPRHKDTPRHYIIAGFFIALGIILIWGYAPLVFVAEPLISNLAYSIPSPNVPIKVIAIPTAITLVMVGSLYVVSGTLAFFKRMKYLSVPLFWFSGALMFPAILIAAAAGKQTNVLTMVEETLRQGTPLALGALAGIYAERSGVVNIAIEGMMLFGAAFGFLVFVFTGNIWLGVFAALIIGGLSALLHGALSITFKTDQIISGTVINILAIGVTGFLRRNFLINTTGGRVTLPEIKIPILSDLPFIGNALFIQKPIFYTMILLIIGTHMVLFYTRWGLRTRAVGENPRAADTVGINVNLTRYCNLLISGLIAGLGGAWFSLETVGTFDDGMTSGKGFIALAAMIFGKWTPFGSFSGAMLFGFTEALGTRFQILRVELLGAPIPVQWLQILPYIVTIVVLAGLIGRAIPPAAIGKPYEK